MARARALCLLLAAAGLAGGLFGALFNQLLVSVGPGYLAAVGEPGAESAASRLDAAWLGFRRSGFAGVLLAVPVAGLAMLLLPRSRALPTALGALFLAVLLALAGAMLGLAFAMVLPDLAAGFAPARVAGGGPDLLRAGLMDRGAAFGAWAGMLAGVALVWAARPTKRTPRRRRVGHET